ncbi:MAG: ketopantoate reductase family protein [Candidatus Dadabacteria bacterium]|nr:MAG: ketopantoate reductase family protein [Candidatus Dadabacteria bacterium]
MDSAECRPVLRDDVGPRSIAVIGAGPMGASLAAVTSPHVPTVLVARRPERARQIEKFGIEVDGLLRASGRPRVVRSIAELGEFDPFDLIFVATKTTALRQVCRELRPYLGQRSWLVSYQNGIDPGRTLISLLGTPRVVRMVLRYGAVIDTGAKRDGSLQVRVPLHEPPHFVGGEGEALEYARGLAVMIDAMGLPMRFTDDIEGEAWRKGIENAAGNPVAALVQAPLGELLESPARGLIERLLDEGIAVARKAGVAVDPGYRAAVLERMAGGGGHLPSMAEDVRAGRPTEITQLNEQIARRGRQLGVPTPTHDVIVELVRVFDWRAKARGRG